VDCNDHGVGVRELGYIDVMGGEGYRHVRPFGLGNGAFDSNMINLTIIILALPLGLKVCV
jgi:hypothetical protein